MGAEERVSQHCILQRCVGTLPSSRRLHTIQFPSLGLSHLYTCSQACGESIIVHFMVMNGTAWQLSDHHFHSLSCIINLILHYTPFFFSCILHTARTKKGKSPAKKTESREEQASLDGNCGATALSFGGVAFG